jgi:hypothetical protein
MNRYGGRIAIVFITPYMLILLVDLFAVLVGVLVSEGFVRIPLPIILIMPCIVFIFIAPLIILVVVFIEAELIELTGQWIGG